MRGNCANLPLAVVDKYFFASGTENTFAYRTGQAICFGCPVRRACMTEQLDMLARAHTGPKGAPPGTIAGANRRTVHWLAKQVREGNTTLMQAVDGALSEPPPTLPSDMRRGRMTEQALLPA